MSCEATIKAWRRIQQVIWKALTLVFKIRCAFFSPASQNLLE
ncbi:hypothetical protein NC651_006272 [Populus alba x Populus x berolinensis]|nr:hypothetical protein NC651_006272 [Populus alba x Populus x berolinensis]